MASFHLSIITPEGKMYDEKETMSLVAPGEDGFFGILAHHAPMIASTVTGTCKVKTHQKEQYFAIDTGVLEVHPDGKKVEFFADKAIACASSEQAMSRVQELRGDAN